LGIRGGRVTSSSDSRINLESAFARRTAFISIDNAIETMIMTFLVPSTADSFYSLCSSTFFALRRLRNTVDDFLNLVISPEGEAAQDSLRGLAHVLTHESDILLDTIHRRCDQQSVVDRGADQNPIFGTKAAGQTEHFSTIGLHEKVAQGSWIEMFFYSISPTEYGLLLAG
jgi:hypothetical protein